MAQATKKNPKLQKALIEAFTLNIPYNKHIYLDNIYFEKFKKYNTFQLLFYDLKVMVMTFRINLKGQGLNEEFFKSKSDKRK